MSKASFNRASRLLGKNRSSTGVLSRVFVFSSILIVLGAIFWYVWDTDLQYQTPELDGILKRVSRYGQLIDPAGEIGVNSVKDVGYQIKGDVIRIIYGKVRIDINEKLVNNETIMQKLKKIGITIENSGEKKKDFKVLYRGAEAKKYE